MKKTKTDLRKLSLQRQTIRKLADTDLRRIHGGNLPLSPWCMPDPDAPLPDCSNQCY